MLFLKVMTFKHATWSFHFYEPTRNFGYFFDVKEELVADPEIH
jgi:hypothetical protein